MLSTDTLISYEAGGRTISDIVAAEGWPGFRGREFALLKKIGTMRNIIVDCGGGILIEAPEPAPTGAPVPDEIFSDRKADVLRNAATVVYVKRDIDWLIGKVFDGDAARPDLGGDYRTLLERRLPWYEHVADHVLDMHGREVEDAVQELLSRYYPEVE